MRSRLARTLGPAAVLALVACSQPNQPANTPLPGSPSAPAASATPGAAPSMLAPTPSSLPATSPSPAPSNAASPVPSPLGSNPPLGEADHGPVPFPTPPAGDALVLANATATATVNASTAYGAIDGRVYTEWSARQTAGGNLALTIDLGAPTAVSRLDLLADASPEVKGFFNVDLSLDGTAFHTVAAGSAFASKQAPQWGGASWPSEQARYVRIVPTSWGTSWVAIWELRLIR